MDVVEPPAFAGFVYGLFFDPGDGGDIFLRNVDLSPNYTALQLGRLYSPRSLPYEHQTQYSNSEV
jgi:hypothetical protein